MAFSPERFNYLAGLTKSTHPIEALAERCTDDEIKGLLELTDNIATHAILRRELKLRFAAEREYHLEDRPETD